MRHLRYNSLISKLTSTKHTTTSTHLQSTSTRLAHTRATTMTELKANLSSYDLETALNADLADKGNGCFVLDVHGGANVGELGTSLKIVLEKVDDYLLNCHDLAAPITKLYIVGVWTPETLATADKPSTEVEDDDASDAGVCSTTTWAYQSGSITHIHIIYLHDRRSRSQLVRSRSIASPQRRSPSLSNRCLRSKSLRERTLSRLPRLTKLMRCSWISGLPLLACVLEQLPKSMTKIILNIGQGICVQQDTEYSHMAYITPTDMKPLLEQTELKELRLFSMQVSLQCVVWETVFRNKAKGGMFLLDLGMATAPLVRKNHWLLAQDVVGLKVVNEDGKDKGYK